jgi:hypothetical protein
LEINKIAIGKIIGTKSFLSKAQQKDLFNAIFRVKPNAPSPQKAGESPGEGQFNEAPGPTGVPRNIPPPPKENRLKKLSEQLALTQRQIAQIDAILEVSQNKYSSLGVPGRGGPLDLMKEMKAIMDEEDAQIEKVLTDMQKKKFTEMKMQPERDVSGKGQNEHPPGK